MVAALIIRGGLVARGFVAQEGREAVAGEVSAAEGEGDAVTDKGINESGGVANVEYVVMERRGLVKDKR